MMHVKGWIVLTASALAFSPMSSVFNMASYAQEQEPAAAPEAGQAEVQDVMTEADLADILVNVLGLATLLPPNPQQADVFAILLQNGISPRDGWNPANVVTLGNLARIMVQAMDKAGNVENPEDDASWVSYLASLGIEFATIEDALGQTPQIQQPVALRAVEVSTDPLRRIPFIRPADDQQLGADLQNFRRLISGSDVSPVPPPKPPPVTPN